MASLENIPPTVIRKIATELRKLSTSPSEGIKVIPNEDDITDIQAIIEGPTGTPYEDGSFRVKLKLGPEFPQSPPKGFFLTKIFHPNVSKNGEICVNTLKRDWKEDLGIEHILLTIKCLLIAPNPESSLNEEAGRLLLEEYDNYAKHARLMTNIHAKRRSGSGGVDEGPSQPATVSKKEGKKKKESCAQQSQEKKKSEKKKKRGLKRL